MCRFHVTPAMHSIMTFLKNVSGTNGIWNKVNLEKERSHEEALKTFPLVAHIHNLLRKPFTDHLVLFFSSSLIIFIYEYLP